MLASSAEKIPAGDWILEPKLDGFRALSAVERGEVLIVSRNGNLLHERFPFAVEALEASGLDGAVLDGEIVARDRSGIIRFELTQQGGGEAAYVVFDLLWLEGMDLRREPLRRRRELLEKAASSFAGGALELSERLEIPAEEALERVRDRGDEGIIAKRASSVYESRRSSQWLKLRFHDHQEFVVVGYKPLTNDADAVGALLLGVEEGSRLRYVGRVGTGFTSEMRSELRTLLDTIRVERPPVVDPPRLKQIVWTRPEIVAEVRYSEWTRDGQLRHPSFLGLRHDRSAAGIEQEKGIPRVRLTSPGNPVAPGSDIRKIDLREYYEGVSSRMLALLRDRPVAVELPRRAKRVPDWIGTITVPRPSRRGADEYLRIDRLEALHWLAQQSVTSLWMLGSTEGRFDSPDWSIISLRVCGDREDHRKLGDAAALFGRFFETLKFPSVPVVLGDQGLDTYLPLAPGQSWDESHHLAARICSTVASGVPEIVVEECRNGPHLHASAELNRRDARIRVPWSIVDAVAGSVALPVEWGVLEDGVDRAALEPEAILGNIAGSRDPFDLPAEGIVIPKLD